MDGCLFTFNYQSPSFHHLRRKKVRVNFMEKEEKTLVTTMQNPCFDK